MNLEEITTGPFTSLSDLIDLAESLFIPDEAYDPPRMPRWAFRGQPKDYGTLVPSFQRIFTTAKKSVGTAEIIESDLLKTFREHYAKLENRTQDMPQPYRISEGYDLRCLSVMQHYGVPTRLLDWTGDGAEEMLVGHNGAIYNHKGRRIGTFATPGEEPTAKGERSMLIGDMTGDGIADVMITTTKAVYIYKNTRGRKKPGPTPLGTEFNFTLY